MTSKYYLVHHKIFDLVEFYGKSKNFNEPQPGIVLKTAFDCGQYSGFSIYEVIDKPVEELKVFVDNQYGTTAYNLIYEIFKDTSGGWMNFQTIEELKDRANNA